ncbi:hypothetical protein VP1G_11444 [Cytospora mali]|uniref:Uncharacterized protein n=1 Tax=Cytospora mali TaxID=578113 RepID=A0A194VGW5_CYTMA|nr:hypothetical protein VP1G_11444 [Valsa mali var. pyri (nom. inval.)]
MKGKVVEVAVLLQNYTSEKECGPILANAVKILLFEADVVCATSYSALEKHTKDINKAIADILVVDKAGAITEAEFLSCTFRQRINTGLSSSTSPAHNV